MLKLARNLLNCLVDAEVGEFWVLTEIVVGLFEVHQQIDGILFCTLHNSQNEKVGNN